MKVVILAGGLGTRISEETHLKPKPMIEIGGKPILWHIMKLYSAHGVNEFVICCGYRGYVIKEYFANYFLHTSDVTFDIVNNTMKVCERHAEPWKVTVVDTGDATMTGGRLKRVLPYIRDEQDFCFTYGDGLADIDINKEIAFHRRHGKLATVAAVIPPGRYGFLQTHGPKVTSFVEKPAGDGGVINGGFFVLSPNCLELIESDHTSWEEGPLVELANQGELMAYEHLGFWRPMDTLRDKNHLEELWASGAAPLEGVVTVGPTSEIDGFYAGKRVLVTGHTGFKGGWLVLWLHRLGAKVHGFALDPSSEFSLFESAAVGAVLTADTRADLADLPALKAALQIAQPEVVFHLAAQPLVRASYGDPLGTLATNVMGTAHVLEAVRAVPSVHALILITTDKVYKNREWPYPYREDDSLGGHDPYSASKAAAEIIASSYRASFFPGQSGHPARVATVRAGNVIGGGDWAPDRLIPDCVRAFLKHECVRIRSPQAVRPWQHVLEPLAGYLQLAQRLCGPEGATFAKAWNFGPDTTGDSTVGETSATMAKLWGEGARVECAVSAANVHEAGLLRLDSTLARTELGWTPRWGLEKALTETVAWYRAWARGDDMARICLCQIRDYVATGRP